MTKTLPNCSSSQSTKTHNQNGRNQATITPLTGSIASAANNPDKTKSPGKRRAPQHERQQNLTNDVVSWAEYWTKMIEMKLKLSREGDTVE